MVLTIHHSHFRQQAPATTKSAAHSHSSSDTSTPPSTPTSPPPQPQPLKPAETHQQPPAPKAPPYRQLPPGKNHYATLNIPITASPPEIQQAYHAALAALPNNTSNFNSESLHAQNVLDEAMHILTHPYKKTIYDRTYTDELLDWHERNEKSECAKGSKSKEGWEAKEGSESSESKAKVKLWRASLMSGLQGEGEEWRFGRVGWAKVKERRVQFQLESDFGTRLEETMLWAPNLFAGGVGGFDGWTG